MSNMFADLVPGVPEHMTWEELAVVPEGVVPLRPRNYILVGEWTPTDAAAGVRIAHPFPIEIGWDALEF